MEKERDIKRVGKEGGGDREREKDSESRES
jgi:hypothetical protein